MNPSAKLLKQTDVIDGMSNGVKRLSAKIKKDNILNLQPTIFSPMILPLIQRRQYLVT